MGKGVAPLQAWEATEFHDGTSPGRLLAVSHCNQQRISTPPTVESANQYGGASFRTHRHEKEYPLKVSMKPSG